MLLYRDITDKIIEAFYEVCHNLSIGYAEKVYERAFVYELKQRGLLVAEQVPLQVTYKEKLIVGDFVADIIVNDVIILELKAVTTITNGHVAQLINYLTTTKKQVGFVFNFCGDRKFVRRIGPVACDDEHRIITD
ncbi:GxxExxY protein [Hoylesella timonensis]|uniref:GxxExxY protein n=1 Tax=Hoylesella timonensis TaxID=386414 RepID=UPI00288AA39B|nr:GxxExxY protein [Hoylesella timonensis]